MQITTVKAIVFTLGQRLQLIGDHIIIKMFHDCKKM